MAYRNYKYLLSLSPGVVTLLGITAGGIWTFGNLFFSLGLIPVLEWLLPVDLSNDEDNRDELPDVVLLLHVMIQAVVLSSLVYTLTFTSCSPLELIGSMLSVGLHSGSSALVVAHELIHRKSKVWQWMGKWLLFSAGNWYFYVEHLRVHHKWVGTEQDPATARRGESLYRFFVRSLSGQLQGAWKLESKRLRDQNSRVYSFRNYVFVSGMLTIFLLLACLLFSGWMLAGVFLGQVLIANFLLEYTNYIEHYGLQRQPEERATELHSWQSDKVISRFLLIDLSRHADHHYYASKPYHRLISYQNSPVLPAGYTTSFYLALFPKVWFRLMNRKLDEFKAYQT